MCKLVGVITMANVNKINLSNANQIRFMAQLENGSEANKLSGYKKEQIQKSENTIKTSTKVIIGTSLAALAAAGIYIATKGKKGLPKNISSLSEFKNQGQLINGEAVLNNGTKYTGELKHSTKSGKEVVLKYENGKLVESNISNTSHTFKGDTTKKPVTIQKKYNYDQNGELQSVNTKIQPTNGDLAEHIDFAKNKYNDINIYTTTNGSAHTKKIFTNEGGKGIDFIANEGKFIKYSKEGKFEFVYKIDKGFAFEPNGQLGPININNKGKIDKLRFYDMEVPEVGKVDVLLNDDRGSRFFDPQSGEKFELSQNSIQYIKEKCKDIIDKTSHMITTNHMVQGYKPPKIENNIDRCLNWYYLKADDLLSNIKFNP